MDDKVGEDSHSAKRARDESGEPFSESPRAKRLHAADRILLDIFEDVDSGDRGPAAGDLATVMRSFEEEIAALSPCLQQPLQQPAEEAAAMRISASTLDADGLGQSDFGFLLEASDDDLGLPPTLPPSSDEGEVVDGEVEEGGGNRGFEGLGQLWAFDDVAPGCYDPLGFGGFAYTDGLAVCDDCVGLGGDLFGYSDVEPSGPSEFSDFSWRAESLPAV